MNSEKRRSPINPEHILELVNNYRKYFKWVWHLISSEEPVWNWHIDIVSNELQRISSYIIDREPAPYDIIFNLPPGMTKSSLITQTLISWLWLHDPSISVIISSYSADLAIDHSLKAKVIIGSEEWRIFNDYIDTVHGSPLYLTKDTEKYWINNYGGFYYATSTGGAVTGKHAHLIIRDDPLNPKQSDSQAERDKCNRFNDLTLSTRKKNKEGTPTITVMQRLHEEDPTGHDLKKKKEGLNIRHICLPATKTKDILPVELVKYYDENKGLLDPKRLSEKILKKERLLLGSYGFAGQYNQSPYPEGGGILKAEWFYTIDDIPKGLLWEVFMDTAYTEDKKNDPTGMLFVAHDIPNKRIVVRDFKSEYLEMPALMKRLPVVMKENGCNAASMVYVEPKASGYSLIQLIRTETYINIVKIKNRLVQASKHERARYISPYAEASRVAFVKGNWNEKLTHELTAFPVAEHDEGIDLLAYACRKYLHIL